MPVGHSVLEAIQNAGPVFIRSSKHVVSRVTVIAASALSGLVWLLIDPDSPRSISSPRPIFLCQPPKPQQADDYLVNAPVAKNNSPI